MAISLSLYAGAGAQFFDNSGVPLNGGLIYTYGAGTTSPVSTYTDSSAATNNTNPIVLDSAGRTPAQIWLTAGAAYKFVLQTSTGVLIKTDDNIYASYELTKEVGVSVGQGGNQIASNVAVGNTALDSNTTGANNTAAGYDALTTNTDGIQNTAFGAAALDANTSGDYNTAVGYNALTTATSADYNTAVGYRALNATSTGAGNTALGSDALLLTTGANNTALGYQAGNALTTGSNNTVIGYDADASSATVSNEVTIGNSSVTSFRVPGLTLTFSVKYFNHGTLTVATLPTAATAGAGARAFVTDANATTFASIVAAGGANGVPVYSDGTNWRIG
jgi:hypothetical protein